jgi:hypothetical protein
MSLAARQIEGGHLKPVILAAIEDGVIVTTSSSTSPANRFVYVNLTRISGPQSASGTDYDMDTDSDIVSSIFEYQVPAGFNFKFSRINITMLDGAMRPGQFGGLGAALTNGCLFQIVDVGGAEVLDFTDGVPITFNLPPGFRIRWTNRDDVSGLTTFRMMVQGLLSGV